MHSMHVSEMTFQMWSVATIKQAEEWRRSVTEHLPGTLESLGSIPALREEGRKRGKALSYNQSVLMVKTGSIHVVEVRAAFLSPVGR